LPLFAPDQNTHLLWWPFINLNVSIQYVIQERCSLFFRCHTLLKVTIIISIFFRVRENHRNLRTRRKMY
jgi:hypothetical protein